MNHRYQNAGMFFCSKQGESFQTVLVIGYERSGTSMVAGLLHRIGVFMGDGISSPVYEDEKLGNALRKNADYRRIIEDYNRRYTLWGLKRPVCNEKILKRIKLFRNPLIVHIARDPVAVTARTAQVYQKDYEASLMANFKKQMKLSQLVAGSGAPVWYCSYEKILLSPGSFIDTLLQILELPAPEAAVRSQWMEFMQPSPVGYLDVCVPFGAVHGHVDRVVGRTVSGWAAYYRAKTDSPVTLDIFVNDVRVRTVVCDGYREDLLVIHPTGHCAFEAELDMPLSRGIHSLQVVPTGETVALPFSTGFSWES